MIVLSFSGKAGAGKDSAAKALMDQMIADGLRVCRISFAGKLKDACCVLYGWDRDRLESDPFYKEGGLGGWVPKDKPGDVTRPHRPKTGVETGGCPSDKADYELSLDQCRAIDERAHREQLRDILENWIELDKDPICVLLGMTRRVIMQKVGTEAFRDQIHEDHWVLLEQAKIDRGEYDDVDVCFITDARFLNELSFARRNNGKNILIQRTDEGTLTQHTSHASEQEWQKQTNWDVFLTNNVAAGLDELKRNVVQTVYTALVQDGMKNFPFHIQVNLVNKSLFGLANRPMMNPFEMVTAAALAQENIPERMILTKPVLPAGLFSMAKDRAQATLDQATKSDFIRDVVEPSKGNLEEALRRNIAFRNRGEN